jgi:lipoate-protein ligase A
MTMLDLFIKWPEVIENLELLAADEMKRDEYIATILLELIKKEHPDDYQQFYKLHSEEINSIKKRASREYGDKLKRYIKAVREYSSRH